MSTQLSCLRWPGVSRLSLALLLFIACRGTPSGPKAEPDPAVATEPEKRPLFTLLAQEPRLPPRDFDAVRDGHSLRVLLRRSDLFSLPRQGSPLALTMSVVEFVASEAGVTPRYIVASSQDELIQGLSEGRADLVAAQLATGGSRLTGVAVTTAVRHVDEVVVVPKTMASPPTKLKELAGKTLHAKPTTLSFAAVSKRATVKPVDEAMEAEDMLARVGSGELPMAVAYSEDVEAYLSYRDDVAVAFTLVSDVPMVWAVAQQAHNLLEAINGVIYQNSLTSHLRAVYGGDLDAIRRHRVIRVAMQNDAASYFVYRGQQVGFQFELAEHLAMKLGVRLEVVIPERPNDMARMLIENQVDLAAMAVTDELSTQVDFSRPYMFANQVLVQANGEPAIDSVESLSGKTIHVRRSSAYFETLRGLLAKVPGLRIVEASEDLETHELIGRVGRKELPLSVSNSVLLQVETTYRDDVQGTLELAKRKPLAYAMRKGSPQLKAWVDQFLKRQYRGLVYNSLYKKYFKDKKRIRRVRAEEAGTTGRLSPYDDLAKKYGRKYGIDWRLIVAQMYQESRFNPEAKSWVGAMGLMQVMPKTGAELGFRNLRRPESNVHAGVKYLARMAAKFDVSIPMRQRVRFALASYNAGLGHVLDARRLARKKGWDANRWFGNVENAIKLLENPRYHRRARYGYCRGSEPAVYVSRIQSKYDAYVAVVPPGT